MDLHVGVCWFGVKHAGWVCGIRAHNITTCKSRTPVLFDACVRIVEGCGLIADVPNPLVK
jgi:hypothetical protein